MPSLLDEPRLSVILSPAASPERLRACLSGLAAQSAIGVAPIEVIVMQQLGMALEPGALNLPFAWKVIPAAPTAQSRPVTGTLSPRAAAWNRGLLEARAASVLFLDGDLEPDSGLVTAHLAAQERGACIALGPVRMKIDGRLPPRLEEPGLPQSWSGYLGATLSLPREQALAAGGFLPADPPGREEVAMVARLSCPDYPVVLLGEPQRAGTAPIARATAFRELDGAPRHLLAQARALGQADVALYQHYPQLVSHLPLGHFNDLGMRGMLLRRASLRLPRFLDRFSARPNHGGSAEWSWFAYTLAYWQGVRAALHAQRQGSTWQRLTHGPLILMYHAICEAGARPGLYSLPVERFHQQLTWIKRSGRQVIALDELLNERRAGRLPAPRSVVITFDDGYYDSLRLAAPLLARFGYPATVFVVAGAVGQPGGWNEPGELQGRALLRFTDMGELRQLGVSIGAHGYTHRPLAVDPAGLIPTTAAPRRAVVHAVPAEYSPQPGNSATEGLPATEPALASPVPETHSARLTAEELRMETAGARQALEFGLGQPVRTLSYPHGSFNTETMQAVEQAGYLGACCSQPGVCDPAVPSMALRRLEIRGSTSLPDFILALRMGKTHVIRRIREAQ